MGLTLKCQCDLAAPAQVLDSCELRRHRGAFPGGSNHRPSPYHRGAWRSMWVIDADQRTLRLIGRCRAVRLLHFAAARRSRCDDHQDVVGQHRALILRLPELLAVLTPVRQQLASSGALPASPHWSARDRADRTASVDGQRAFLQRPGLLRLPQVPQDRGQVVQAGGDGGVVRAVGGLGDGQRAFLQRPGPLRLPQVPQDQGQVVQVGATSGWSGP